MKAQDLQEIAWNGIQFKYPSSWRIGALGACHLCLEDDDGPCMEIKWGPLKGRFSPEAYLRRLNKRHKKSVGRGAGISSVPESWVRNIKRFEYEGFSWQTGVRKGKGVILCCGICNTVSVVHFFPGKENGARIPYEAILDSFQDHHPNGEVPWSVFGLHAIIPETFLLVSHRFEAGIAELMFSEKHRNIRLFRWGPASVLLENRTLEMVARGVLDLPKTDSEMFFMKDWHGLQWHVERRLLVKLPGFIRLGKRPCFERTCLWHAAGKNRILGVTFTAQKPFDIAEMEQVLNGYETS